MPSFATETPAAPIHSSTGKSFLQDVSKIQEDIANDDVNGFYRTLEGQRLARKQNRKKKRKDAGGTYTWTWEDEYDPTHPNDYDSYIDSDEHLREQIEWKRFLHGKEEIENEPERERWFAPPEVYEQEQEEETYQDEDDAEFIPEPVAQVDLDESADEVYARRMRLAQEAGLNVRPPSPPTLVNYEGVADEEAAENEAKEIDDTEEKSQSPIKSSSPPPHPTPSIELSSNFFYSDTPSPFAAAPGVQPAPSTSHTTISSGPVHYQSATISSEPVIYETAQPSVAANQPQENVPGQKDFASRLMSKYGWQKGQSLGAQPTAGLITPLIMKQDKDKKGTGVIVNRNKMVEDHGKFGKMSRCIVLSNVVGRGEVDDELANEIGGECRDKVCPTSEWGELICSMEKWREYELLKMRMRKVRRKS